MGYPLSIIKDLKQNEDLLRDKDVLTLGSLFPSNISVKSFQKIGLGDLSHIDQNLFSVEFLQMRLLCKSVATLDVDDYQSATVIANLNVPLEKEFHSKYDVVLDLGTLEHLSNFSNAIVNIFNLLKKDGVYYFAIPANNWCNHGFFQLSPTFFVDLCKYNPHLELMDMFYATDKHLVRMGNANKYVKRAFELCSERILVGGSIKKKNLNEIDLDLVQSKYANAYAQHGTQAPISSMIKLTKKDGFLDKILGGICKLPGLSLGSKLRILGAKEF